MWAHATTSCFPCERVCWIHFVHSMEEQSFIREHYAKPTYEPGYENYATPSGNRLALRMRPVSQRCLLNCLHNNINFLWMLTFFFILCCYALSHCKWILIFLFAVDDNSFISDSHLNCLNSFYSFRNLACNMRRRVVRNYILPDLSIIKKRLLTSSN